jgi:FkbM family methyltransferase
MEAELKALLAEDVEEARRRERAAFDGLAAPFADRLVLFGAGNLGRKTLAGLRRMGVEPLAFADNNPALWGTRVEGLAVHSVPEAAATYGQNAAFVVAIWLGEGHDRMGDRQKQLREAGCRTVVPFNSLFWKYAEVFLPHYTLDLPHRVLEAREDVLAAFSLLSDGASRLEFLAQVRWRLRADYDSLPDLAGHEIYFPADLVELRGDEAFVDCGAFDGDSTRAFLARCGGTFASIDAFEPDPANFRKLEAFRSSLAPEAAGRFHLHQAATGRQACRLSFEAQGTGSSHVGSGDLQVDCLALDEALEGRRPTILKMDIEGSELDTLAGAAGTIREAMPMIAVSAYHLQDHVWKVPLLIRSLAPGYRFHLRPHCLDGWDLVCYAVPPGRLRA